MDSCHSHADMSSHTPSHCSNTTSQDDSAAMMFDGADKASGRKALRRYRYTNIVVTVVLIAAALWDLRSS
jgi:hypothetical protein